MAIRWQDFIEERKGVMMGKPVFKGTRLTVEHVLGEMGAGMTDPELLDNYPTLRPEHIRERLLRDATSEMNRISPVDRMEIRAFGGES